MIRQYSARYSLLDGSPRELWPIYAEDESDALRQAMDYVTFAVSRSYDARDIKIKRT